MTAALVAPPTSIGLRDVVVEDATDIAEGILAVTVHALDGATLPTWTPGAHLDVHLPSGLVRQYSLCSDPADRSEYRIAVRLDETGRGGSRELHRIAHAGATLTVSEPRNNFPLVDAPSYSLIAGGIGITPLLAMSRELGRRGRPVRLAYVARSGAHVAFAEELRALAGVSVEIVTTDTAGLPDLARLAADAAAVFACGPASLLTELAERVKPTHGLHVERFAPTNQPVVAGGEFTVELARSGASVAVAADVSILDAVRDAGVDVDSSCEQGICGTCETRVLSGDVDHRDDILTDEEKMCGSSMMICVSRCVGRRLTLDL